MAIARALSIEARIVIMDEPTAALSRKEIDDLFRIVETLKSQGKAILFISHKFDELYEIADRFAVFRDGKAVGHGLLRTTPQDEIVRLMVGPRRQGDLPEALRLRSASRCWKSRATAIRPSSTASP